MPTQHFDLHRGSNHGEHPITRRDGAKYMRACAVISQILRDRDAEPDDIHWISVAKGMYGRAEDRFRCDRRDSWTVTELLGTPDRAIAHQARAELGLLRKSIQSGGDISEFIENGRGAKFWEGIKFVLERAKDRLEKNGYIIADYFCPEVTK